MNNDEILTRAQKEAKGKMDERERSQYHKALALGLASGMILCGFIMMIQGLVSKKLNSDCFVIYFGMSSVIYIYTFAKLKYKKDLVWGVVCILLFLFFLLAFIGQILGK